MFLKFKNVNYLMKIKIAAKVHLFIKQKKKNGIFKFFFDLPACAGL